LNQKHPIIAQRKRNVILLHNNARLHVAKVIKDMSALQWKVIPHAIHLPDCASLDYHLFRLMQHSLADQYFKTYEEIKQCLDE